MEALPRFRRPVVTVGSFDGVHRGHLFLLDALRERARLADGEAVVVTFARHPRSVLGEGVAELTTTDEKSRLIAAAGVDDLVVMPFTPDVARLSAERFVSEFLVDRLGVHELVVGYNHRLGHDREGGGDELTALGERYGFGVYRAPRFADDTNEKISSTEIRRALTRGDLTAAERMLGRSFQKK